MNGVVPLLPLYLHGVHMDNFNLTLYIYTYICIYIVAVGVINCRFWVKANIYFTYRIAQIRCVKLDMYFSTNNIRKC
jgi:hypothetical protein